MESKKITLKKGALQVPDKPIIPFIEGDGIGPDIWASTSSVLNAAVEKAYGGRRKIEWLEVLAGEKAFKKTGEWLPEETLKSISEYLVALKGPLTTPIGHGFASINVTLRQKLDLYACLRPVRYYNGVPSPVKRPQDVDMVIFRENTEDIYLGIEFRAGTKESRKVIEFLSKEMGVSKIRFPETSSIAVKPISVEGTRRLVRAAINYAIENKRKSVTLVHKGNIMKLTEGAFMNWGYNVAEEEFVDYTFTWRQYDKILAEKGEEKANLALEKAELDGKVIIKDTIADIFLQQVLTRTKDFDVIATMNLNGDYISDALAAQVGGIGIAPGANINYATGHALFEATHGTAPKYANLNKVNPSSLIISGAMMLDYIGWHEAATAIHNAIEKTICDKTVTYDFARLMDGATEVSCSEFGNCIIKNLI